MTAQVWYASYGSNLKEDRFLCYIAGGRPPGSIRTNPGCRDRTPPRDRRPLSLNYELYFAGDARSWGGGGVAFIRRGNETPCTLGRMYLITDDQFNDVVLQENSRPVDGSRILPPLEQMTSREETLLPRAGFYGLLLYLGDTPQGSIFTFTTPNHDLKPNAPSQDYIRVIAAGLRETYPEMSDGEICDYLLRTAGIRGALPPERLAAWIASA